MLLRDLLKLLEDVEPDTEVRLAMQPSWPFEHRIGDVKVKPAAKELLPDEVVESMDDDARDIYMRECEDGIYSDIPDDQREVVYIVEDGQIGYLPGVVQKRIGW